MPAIEPPGPAACSRPLFTHINTRNFRIGRKPDRSVAVQAGDTRVKHSGNTIVVFSIERAG
jgi:hypothetical protein